MVCDLSVAPSVGIRRVAHGRNVFNGISFRVGTKAEFHLGTDRIIAGVIDKPATIGNRTFPAGTLLGFRPDGKIQFALLESAANIDGHDFPAGTRLLFGGHGIYPEGILESASVQTMAYIPFVAEGQSHIYYGGLEFQVIRFDGKGQPTRGILREGVELPGKKELQEIVEGANRDDEERGYLVIQFISPEVGFKDGRWDYIIGCRNTPIRDNPPLYTPALRK